MIWIETEIDLKYVFVLIKQMFQHIDGEERDGVISKC